MLVRLSRVLDEALAPAGRSFGSDAAQPFEWIPRIRDRLFELLSGFDPGDDDSVRSDVERPLDQPAVEFRDSHERDGLAADGRAQMFDDVFPVEMPVLGIDHDPVQAERDRHLGDAG